MEISNLGEAEGLLIEFQNLTKSRAWELLVEDALAQIEGREETVHAPLPSMDELYTREYLKGEISGMYTILGYPQLAVENLEAHINDLRGSESDE